jgi:hypothetical protein
MSEQPEVGRPNYTAGGASGAAGPGGSRPGGVRGPGRRPEPGSRVELRAIAAFAAALFAWSSWTPFYSLPIAAALVAAILAARWGRKAKQSIEWSDGLRTGATLADLARVLGLADLAVLGYLLFHYYFIAHAGLAGVVDLLFT